jgi:hypothetical protein
MQSLASPSTPELQQRLRTGTWVFVALILLTLVEFAFVFVVPGGPLLLVLLAVFQFADAGLIIWYFMHLGHLWHPPGH